ncbi:MAG: 1-acyl-sn-glycerol-3-phosphate acyltransferase [Planctomycetaceae bacterium]|nr:1-acyl-sn-glycerol-3-phosphate acyltransferase [Planctomycetaceae bacterium]
MVNSILRYLFFLCIVRPVVLIVLGLNVRRQELLPTAGPAIVVANHNSHLDALTLMTLFGMRRLHLVRPVAAVDYFMSNKWLAWFSTQIIGIIPLNRNVSGERSDPLAGISDALNAGNILILFPEGSRGQPEQLETFRTGIAHIAKRHPGIPIVPVFLHGLGKSLPRGEGILVPFFCDIFVGESVAWSGSRDGFMVLLQEQMTALAQEGRFPRWQ